MLYHMRVATFWQASVTPNTEVIMASSVSHHSEPQIRCAITSAGSSAEGWSFVRSSVPQPITWPHCAITSMMPMIRMEAMIERGTLRRGFEVSSASGTAASHPVSPCTVRTTARKTPEKVAIPPGLKPGTKGAKEKPPGPGLDQTGKPEEQHDQKFGGADGNDPFDRERHAGKPCPGSQRNPDQPGRSTSGTR